MYWRPHHPPLNRQEKNQEKKECIEEYVQYIWSRIFSISAYSVCRIYRRAFCKSGIYILLWPSLRLRLLRPLLEDDYHTYWREEENYCEEGTSMSLRVQYDIVHTMGSFIIFRSMPFFESSRRHDVGVTASTLWPQLLDSTIPQNDIKKDTVKDSEDIAGGPRSHHNTPEH